MRCLACQRPLTPLFSSFACDYCDGHRKPAKLFKGFVIWKGAPNASGAKVYVFPTREDAERYRDGASATPAPDQRVPEIREAVSEHELRFHRAGGAVANVTMGEQLLLLFPDHRHEPGPWRGYCPG